MNNTNLSKFESTIKYSFNNIELLKMAFTHSSYANEKHIEKYDNNERLEFLGDAILELVISDYIYCNFPRMPEGELTKLRAGTVCESSLAEKARNVRIGEFLMLGKGEEATGGRDRDSILADTFEAVIGAIYLDGGIVAAKKYIGEQLESTVNKINICLNIIDCKTRLQEEIQKVSKEPLQYEIINETGPDHNKVFTSVVKHSGSILGTGGGKSKKEAEQSAAATALKEMNIIK
ncbi:MAG: ribonuclease III [Candidatus Metalachnospira sp.]|nr:ribonuclease III [Candidatus Metalachnospira sp.]